MRKVKIISAILIFIFVGYIYLYFNPIFIGGENVKAANDCNWSNNLCNPVENIDFSCGSSKIIIYTGKAELQFLPDGVKQRTLLYCTDNSIIQQIKKHFVFERKGEDYAETTYSDSKIYFFKDSKVVFRSPIILEDIISIHFEKTGWVFSTRYDILKSNFTKFKPMYNPVVIL